MGKMYSLFSEFNWQKTEERVIPRVERFLITVATTQFPKFDTLRDRFTMNIVSYIEAMAYNHGQESKTAMGYAVDAEAEIGVLESAGFIRENWVDLYRLMVQNILFDEMRRCGIGKVNGWFVEPEKAG